MDIIENTWSGIVNAAEAYNQSIGAEDKLSCSWCAREVDAGAYTDSEVRVEVIRSLIEHTAYDHSGRADIIWWKCVIVGRVARMGEVV